MGIGHLFVIDGDLKSLAVDAWYLPVDQEFQYTGLWLEIIYKIEPKYSRGPDPWQSGELARFFGRIDNSDVWLGNVGRPSGVDPSHFVDCARQFAKKTTEKWHRDYPNKTRLPLIAINHLGTGRGGGKITHGDVITTLIKELSDDLNEGRLACDIVIVSWGPTPESAAQHARFKRITDWKSDPQWAFEHNQNKLHEKAIDLSQKLRIGQGAIFMGAGVAKGAGLPGWTDLLCAIGSDSPQVATREDLLSLSDPRDMANLLEHRLRERHNNDPAFSLARKLADKLVASKYSLQHGLLSSLPCNEFITTNVDELFEKAATASGSQLKVIPDQTDSKRWLLKLHGSVADESSLIFTRDSFLNLGRNSRALFGLVQAMLFTRHMLFVGYGLGDEDFHEVVYDVRSAFPDRTPTDKIGTALILVEDPIKAELWNDTLEIVAMRPKGDDLGVAARDLERFLDLIGMLSSDRSAFMMDPEYGGLLEKPELALRDRLMEVAEMASSRDPHDSTWREIRQLLSSLGHDF